jgi:hypothetical protein
MARWQGTVSVFEDASACTDESSAATGAWGKARYVRLCRTNVPLHPLCRCAFHGARAGITRIQRCALCAWAASSCASTGVRPVADMRPPCRAPQLQVARRAAELHA